MMRNRTKPALIMILAFLLLAGCASGAQDQNTQASSATGTIHPNKRALKSKRAGH
ncbi:hypothetical protein P9222_23770 [Paenibacillus amylolyticus]|nr:hypothetical protein [Paenibacillus amylolyticus]WFR61437.1 hypothetical protein P9222_23770 [Paenibacillus amylolyticus]